MNKERKHKRYERLYTQLAGLLEGKTYPIARMSTVVAVLHHKIDYFFWTGFYLLQDGELIVGPYQGPVACILLEKNKGVCWAGINQGKTLVVPDVHKFPGHIACDSRSNSEIVVPLKDSKGKIYGVLDVDSREHAAFDEADAEWLEKILDLL
ncbi:MAG: GAF domain-containing protein [Bacteroidales bacterium]|jgi:GAF domain-containing protein|nr:GAF domain-containing protein [Bacteroidales bacterium]